MGSMGSLRLHAGLLLRRPCLAISSSGPKVIIESRVHRSVGTRDRRLIQISPHCLDQHHDQVNPFQLQISSRTVAKGSTNITAVGRRFVRHVSSAAPDSVPEPAPLKEGEAGAATWQVKMLYDGDCPLCMREVNMLRERNELYKGAIKFVDIAALDFSPEDNAGIDFVTAMGKIHAIERDGSILTDIAAFRRFYEAVGLGWVYAITKNKAVGRVADAVYGFWAKYRLPITGRPALAVVLEERRKRLEGGPLATCDAEGARCKTE
eukprot:TRINITY_DN26483_c0_g1_i1.p1 TRINITY_DN26483_c0_g1~~TRINITY_DN26483_c0_g1_i1.p1  ORF type:complete len:264 (-),score=30.53 TRINITY_DN26483_c0_g1_i1:415-1206(-)